jgi:hypothetical protein
MGQYFIIANIDKKECVELSPKLWEICANNDCRILPYLLADGNADGVNGLYIYINPEEKEKYSDEYEVVCETEFTCHMIRKTEFFGRWSGDRIVVAGDYGYSGIYEAVKRDPAWLNITGAAVREFNEFMGLDELKIKENMEYIRPDLVLSG